MQHFVENLLKVLKVLKTRTALTRNGLAEFRLRYTRQGAKAPIKTKEQGKRLQNYYNRKKSLKKLLTNSKIESEKERMVLKMRKPRLSKETIKKLMHGETVTKGIYEYKADREWNEDLYRFDEVLLRWSSATEEYECWILGPKGLYEFEAKKG